MSNVIPEFRGAFVQNTWGLFSVRVYDADGRPVDAESMTLEVMIEGGTDPVIDHEPEKLARGFYVYDWSVPSDQTPGVYNVTWSYTLDGEDKTVSQQIVVSADQTDLVRNSWALAALRFGLEQLLGGVQTIPIHHEQNKPSKDHQTYRFTFPRWNQPVGVKVYVNDEEQAEGFEVDYLNGKVIFDEANTEYDRVNIDYNFRWFSDDQMDRALFFGLQQVNVYPPQTPNATFETMGDMYVPAVTYSAAADLLRTFLFELGFPQNKAIFGGKDEVDSWRQTISEMIKDYQEKAKGYLDNKKNFSYVGLTRSIIGPTHNIPGGRSRWFRMMFGTNVG